MQRDLVTPRRVGGFELEQCLGVGGMGAVYRALPRGSPTPVALKRFHPSLAGEVRERARLLREAQIAARLHHPAIVRIHDYFEAEGASWIVMEFAPGHTLAEELKKGALPWRRAVDLGEQIAGGLAAAHGAGIVHCDLKTENVMLTPAGKAKILDFGIARLRGEAGPPPGGRVAGTPRAMSPEQILGCAIDPRSDLFSFGGLLYETLTGTSPFRGGARKTVLARICTWCPPSVVAIHPGVPEGLSELVDALLEKDPTRRPQHASEVLRWLRRGVREGRWPGGWKGARGGPPEAFPRSEVEGTWETTAAEASTTGSG